MQLAELANLTIVSLLGFLMPIGTVLFAELPVIAYSAGGRPGCLRAGIVINSVTTPVWLFLLGMVMLHGNDIWFLVIGGLLQFVVVLAEWRMLERLMEWSSRRAFVTSVAMNTLSSGVLLVFVAAL